MIHTEIQDVHSWLHSTSCSCPQPVESIHHNLRDLWSERSRRTCPRLQWFRADLLASTLWHSVLNWSSVSTTRILELVVDCVVAFSATAANVNRLSSGAGLPAAIAVPPFELCMMPCSTCSVSFSVRHSNFRLILSLYNFIGPQYLVFLLSNPEDLTQRARNTPCFLSDLHT